MIELYQVVEYKQRTAENTATNGDTVVGAEPKSQWQRVRGTGSLVSFTPEAAQELADKLAGETPAGDPPRRFEVRPFVRLSSDQEEPTEEDL
jgi:hypothetical protein